VQSKANRNAKYLSIRFPEKERKKKIYCGIFSI